ncbi:hypothetical protein MHYP_G00233030 [Metynnis hypsauchen]
MNTKKKREKRKCCPFICCAAVEDDVEVTQESRLPTFKKLAGKASMAQLGNRLDLNNTHEETMVHPDLDSDTEVTVVFQRPIESISGMDKQIVQMQSAVKCSFMESSSDGAAVRMCLRELFDITKGTYFSYIQDELIRSMRSMVPQEMWAAVNVHTTFSLISSIYEDVLKKAVADKIESEIFSESATPKQSSCPCDSSVVEETPSSQGRDDFDRKERREVATCSVVTEKLLNSHRPRCESVLESIILNNLNQNSDTDSTERDTQRLLRLSVHAFLDESSNIVNHIIKNETTEITRTSPVFDSTLESSMVAAAAGVYLSECSDVSSEDSFVEELYSRPRFPRIRLPKLRFKKQNNRMEATTVLAEDQTQNQPLPTEKPSNAPTTSAAVPKRKTFFSRVSAAFCRVFRKGAKTSA